MSALSAGFTAQPAIALASEITGREVWVVARRVVTKDVVKRIAVRSTKASAKLEDRSVPAGYVRSASVQKFLAERRPRPE
ncbi:hypothetical protein A5791_24005 [Mycobacterium sp. 852002-51163_SCH5372311]|nr:hypothetical protein A5791_24005 [Mycobacterium sp. 852002-51163_SCH5372311]